MTTILLTCLLGVAVSFLELKVLWKGHLYSGRELHEPFGLKIHKLRPLATVINQNLLTEKFIM